MNLRKLLNDGFSYLMLALVALIFTGPFVWMLLTALKSNRDVLAWPPVLVPHELHWENFVKVFQHTAVPRSLVNSLIVAVVATFINVLFSSLAAFGFARLRFAGRNALFFGTLATMMIPSGLLVVPLFFMMRMMPGGPGGWLNTFQGIIIPTSVTAFSIFLLRQNYLSIPMSLDEAAEIDGCGPLRIWWHIILPMSRPSTVLVTVFSFLARWNDYLWPLTVARSTKMYTLQVALRFFQTEYNIEWPLMMAGAAVAAVPIIIMYIALQSFFEQGMAGLGRGVKE
jgi:multiple sugar transport system permease protein